MASPVWCRGTVVARASLEPHFERGVEIGGFDDYEPPDVLFAFGERAIRGENLPVLEPHDRGRARRVESAVEHPRAGGLHLLAQRVDVSHHGLQHMGRRSLSIGLVDAEQVLVHRVLPWFVAGVLLAFHPLHERPESGSTSNTTRRIFCAEPYRSGARGAGVGAVHAPIATALGSRPHLEAVFPIW